MPTNRAPERERNPQQVRCPGVAAAWLPATPSESRSDLSRTLPTVMAAPCSLGSGEFQKFRGFFLFQLSSRSNYRYYTVSYGNANRFLCLTFVSQTLRQADVILWLYFVMTSCIHFTILQLILLIRRERESLGSCSQAVWHGVREVHAARRGAERRGEQGVGRRCAGFHDLLAPARAARCALASRQTVAPVMTQGRCGCCQWQALTASRGF